MVLPNKCPVFLAHTVLYLRWDVIITDIIYFGFEEPSTQQPQCFLISPLWSQSGLDLHSVSVLNEPTLTGAFAAPLSR